MSVVYFVGPASSALVKIGTAVDFKRRLGELQNGCPDLMTLHGTVPGGQRLEARIHKTLWRYRVRGEWFQRADALTFLAAANARGVESAIAETEKQSAVLAAAAREQTRKRKGEIQAAVRAAFQRAIDEHGEKAVCEATGFSPPGLANALRHKGCPESHRLLNLLTLSGDLLDGVFAIFGLRLEAIVCEADRLRS
jgi:hypothetical protein